MPSVAKLLHDRQPSWVALNELLRGYEIVIPASISAPDQIPSPEKIWRDVAEASFVNQSNGDVILRSWSPNVLLAVKSLLKTTATMGTGVRILALRFGYFSKFV